MALASAWQLMSSSTMPSTASRDARISGVVPSCMRAFRSVARFLIKIYNMKHKLLNIADIFNNYSPTFRITFTFRRRFYPKQLTISTFDRRKKQQYEAVGTVRIFIEPSTNNH